MRRSTSPAIAPPPRNLVRIGLFAVAGVLLALLSLSITVAMVFQRTQPGLARAWWPWGAQARAEIAVMTAQEAVTDATSVKRDALARANARARLALSREPVNVAAARAIGLLYAASGRDGPARASFAYSETLSRRDLSTQLWLIEERAAAGDVPGAMRHYDRALRSSREAYDLLVPVLIQASAQPDVTRELARLMAPRPDWWLALTDPLLTTGPSAAAIAQVMLAIRLDPDRPIDRDLSVAGLRRLVELGDSVRAWRVYRDIAARKGWGIAAVGDGGFDAANDLPPFGWTLADTPQVSASKQALDSDPANPVLQLTAEEGAQGEFANQTLMLRPGSYRFIARTGGIEAGASARPVLSITCPNGRTIGGAVLAPAQGQVGFAFAVPRGCVAQRLSVALPTAADAPVSAWIDAIVVTPVPART